MIHLNLSQNGNMYKLCSSSWRYSEAYSTTIVSKQLFMQSPEGSCVYLQRCESQLPPLQWRVEPVARNTPNIYFEDNLEVDEHGLMGPTFFLENKSGNSKSHTVIGDFSKKINGNVITIR